MQLITCDRALELISARLDSVLSHEEEATLAEHLSACADCAALAADLETLHVSMPELNVEPPAFLLENVMAQIRAEQPAPIPFPTPRRMVSRRWRQWGATAAVVAVVALGAFALRPSPGDTSGDAPLAVMSVGVDSAAPKQADALTPEGYAAPAGESSKSAELPKQNPESAPRPEPTATPELAEAGGHQTDETARPRASLMTPNGGATEETALTRLWNTCFPGQEGNETAEGLLLGDSLLTYRGMSADGAYFLFDLTAQDETLNAYAVPMDENAPIRTLLEDGDTFPAE